MEACRRVSFPLGTFFEKFPFMERIDEVSHRISPVLVVGGAFRDYLLEGKWGEPDITSPQAARLVKFLTGEFEVSPNPRFLTFKLKHASSDVVVDVAQARREHYPYPGALPYVEPSSIYEDFCRRDFTITAYAFFMGPYKNYVYDPFGGIEDTRRRVLKIFRKGVFSEDPTRILRGLRFASRFSLKVDPATADSIKKEADFLGSVSSDRIKKEFVKSVVQSDVLSLFDFYLRFGIIRYIFHGFPDERGVGAVQNVLKRFQDLKSSLSKNFIWPLFVFLAGRLSWKLNFSLTSREKNFYRAGCKSRSSVEEALWFLRNDEAVKAVVYFFFDDPARENIFRIVKNPLTAEEKLRMLSLPVNMRGAFIKETFRRKIKIYLS